MKKKRFSVEQIVAVLKQAELGVPVAEVIRKVGISEQTFYRWKKQYVGTRALHGAGCDNKVTSCKAKLIACVVEYACMLNSIRIAFKRSCVGMDEDRYLRVLESRLSHGTGEIAFIEGSPFGIAQGYIWAYRDGRVA